MIPQRRPKPNHLEPSPLGTKQYWDELYSTELSNHSLDARDEGTIWFADSAAESKLLRFLQTLVVEKQGLGAGVEKRNCSFLDLGTGNGHFLFALRSGEGDEVGEGWGGRMMGVDYSEQSIGFAERIAVDKGYSSASPSATQPSSQNPHRIEFHRWDIMAQSPRPLLLESANENGWDVVLDKGTFDAISLSEERDGDGRRVCEGYKERVVALMRDGGVFLVTSCNWTEEELEAWFAGEGGGGELEVLDRVKYRSFSFGGRKGQTISSVCFRKCGVR